MKLNELRENPDNPSTCTEKELERLAKKLKRVPLGLTAMRIAYVTDDPEGGKMVISGNKRLRVLKKTYGDDANLPDEWFQDVTAMSEAERHEFIVTANVCDGEWDLDKLLDQYGNAELEDYGLENLLKYADDEGDTTTDDQKDIDADLSEVSVVIECESEKDAQEKYEKLVAEGYKCRISTL